MVGNAVVLHIESWDTIVMAKPTQNQYSQIIERIFQDHYELGAHVVAFERDEIERVARELDITLPKNLGDLIYSFRYRTALPEAIRSHAPEGHSWIIRPAGRARY